MKTNKTKMEEVQGTELKLGELAIKQTEEGTETETKEKAVSKSQFLQSLKNNASRARKSGLLSEEGVTKLIEVYTEARNSYIGEELF